MVAASRAHSDCAAATTSADVTVTCCPSYGTVAESQTQTTASKTTSIFATFDESITLLHEEQPSDTRPLLERPSLRRTGGCLADKMTSGPTGRTAAKFRYLVAALIMSAITMNTYANYTLYIASIEMISNDVLQSGMTELRARHLSNDPLAKNKNAAAPGTCPVQNAPKALEAARSLVQAAGELGPKLNASELSAREQHLMQLDATALFTSVHERLADGQLVDWTISQRGYIFTAHNIGGILLAVPISRLGLVVGSKAMVFVCVLVTGVRMLALPSLAGHSPFWLTFLFELVMGGPGASIAILAYPIAAAWLLPDEANFFLASSQLFVLMGTAATNFISTQLLAHQVAWCWCYYLPGILLCVIALLWLALGADRPGESRFVSRSELELLASERDAKLHVTEEGARGQADWSHKCTSCACEPQERDQCPALKLKRTPIWSTIFTCPTVWGLVAVNFSYHWNAKIATLWPTFFANILHMDSSTIGLITGAKGIVALVFGLTFAYFTRHLSIRRPLDISLTAYRRLNQVLATLVLGVSVALMVLMDCNVWANFVSVLLTPVVTGFNSISHEQMPLDLSSEDSGLLVSVIRLVSIGDIVALPASSYLLSFAADAVAGDRFTWRLVWLSGLALKVLTCLFFVLVARSKPKSYSRLESAGACKALKRRG